MFDWQNLVITLLPGDKTPEAVLRQNSLAPVMGELTKWAKEYGMWEDRVKATAFTGVCTAPAHTDHEIKMAIARHALWFYSLDDYIDRNQRLLKDKEVSYLDRQLAGLVPGLELMPDLNMPKEAWSILLANAFNNMLEKLAILWQKHPQKDWLLQNVKAQAIRMILAMREELCISFDFNVPSLATYVELAQYSIGVRAVASVTIGMEANPAEVWQICEPDIIRAMRIVRLANDLGNYTLEIEEKKITGITCALVALGYTEPFQYTDGSPQVTTARNIVKNRLDSELTDFGKNLEQTNFSFWLKAVTALALTMYSKGNYLIPS
jgi:hypothetical protein